jgi:C4-dicarboxylate transporter, DctM subunit
MDEVTIGIIGIVVLLIVFSAGLELAFAMILVGFVGFAYLRSTDAALSLLAKDFYDTFASYSFAVIPLFVLMGQIAYNSGMAEEMYKTARKLIGHVPGGLALATVVGATIFKAISGSTLATSATFSSVAIPEMDKYGYARTLSTGTVASVGTLGLLLPPSGFLILFAMITEQSIGRLFLAGIIPGLIAAFFFLVIIIGWCKVYPEIAPKGPLVGWSDRMRSLAKVFWPLLIFVVVVGGLLAGFFTPTEAGSAGSIAVLVLTVLKKDLNFRAYVKSVFESLRMGCMVLLLVAGSQVLGHFITMAHIPALVAQHTASLAIPPWAIIVMIIFIYLLGGSFIDDIAFMILATPIFFPVVQKLGYDPIWFSIIIGVTLMIGVIIPPVAVAVFVVKSITKESIWVVYKGVTPFLLGLVACLVLLFLFPQIATFLPSVLMK